MTRNLIVLTLVSLTQDAASELLYPLLPLIITSGVIGAAPVALGLIEGCAEAAAGFTKLWSGKKSDDLGRKRFVVAGYSVAGIGKALVVLGTTWPTIFLGRVTDRIGKGLRGTPRDALISDTVDKAHLGKAFGFHRTGDNIGAVIGPLLALWGLALFNDDVRKVALWALIPALLSGLLTLFVRETVHTKSHADKPKSSHSPLTPTLKRAISLLVFIQLTNIPDALLLLRLHDMHFSIKSVVLIYAGYSLVTVMAAFPAGVLADKFSPQSIYAIGLVAFALSYSTLGLTNNHGLAILAMLIYGAFPALTDGVGKAWISKLAASDNKGRAQGVYQASMNFAILGAGIWAGIFWSKGSIQWTLVFAAIGALVGALTIYFVSSSIKPSVARSTNPSTSSNAPSGNE